MTTLSKQLCNCLDNECHENLPAGWQCRKVASPGATFPGEDSVGLGAESSRPRGLLTSKKDTAPSNLPQLLRDAERRVNEHVWGDRRAIVSIPADVSRDIDILLLVAADEVERLRRLEDFAKTIYDTFIRTEQQGYHTRDRQYVIDMLKPVLSGDSSAPETSPNPFDHAAIMGDPGNRRISMSFEKREQYEAAIEFLGMGDSPVETKPKPTIEGLERLLQAEDSKQVYVWPDGYVHDTPPPEKAPEAHIDYNVPGCDCLGCELAPKTLVEVRAFGTSIDPPSQKALAPRYELPLEWQAREWTEIDSPSSLCGLLGCNRQTPHHHKAAL